MAKNSIKYFRPDLGKPAYVGLSTNLLLLKNLGATVMCSVFPAYWCDIERVEKHEFYIVVLSALQFL